MKTIIKSFVYTQYYRAYKQFKLWTSEFATPDLFIAAALFFWCVLIWANP